MQEESFPLQQDDSTVVQRKRVGKTLRQQTYSIGCNNHDEQRVVAGLVAILNRKELKPRAPASAGGLGLTT